MKRWIAFTFSTLAGITASATSQGPVALPTVECVAEYRESFDDGTVNIETVTLSVASANPAALIVEGDLAGYGFTLAGNQLKDSFMVTIAEGPNYTRGATYRGSFGDDGEMTLSVVEGDRVYSLLCTQN